VLPTDHNRTPRPRRRARELAALRVRPRSRPRRSLIAPPRARFTRSIPTMTWFHAARARLRLLAPRATEARIDDELRFHIEMETQRLVREQRLDPDEARRRALATF